MKNKGHLLVTLVMAVTCFLAAPVDSHAQSFLNKPI
jgi:hypothetical protein